MSWLRSWFETAQERLLTMRRFRAGVLVAAPQEAKHYTARHWAGSARYDDWLNVQQAALQ
jgi:hypothetical protein